MEFDFHSTGHLKKPRTEAEVSEILKNPGFSNHITDHMVLLDYSPQHQWHNYRLVSNKGLLTPASTAFAHSGQAIFEGLKAYKHSNGSVWAFRPEKNAERLQKSAQRIALPEPDTNTFLKVITDLVKADQRWLDSTKEHAFYVRPLIVGSDPLFKVQPSASATFITIGSPSGNYFATGIKPAKIWLEEETPRAVIGGTGEAKFSGNYAGVMIAQRKASEYGCDQVLFVDAIEKRWIEELGAMNIFFITKDQQLITPSLDGTILRGITRDSLITLAHDRGLEVQERKISKEELFDSIQSGNITEIFACGTAATVVPIRAIVTSSGTYTLAQQDFKLTLSLRQELIDIQSGTKVDTHSWLYRLF
ncbi:MAG: branched-chain amino acid aminotransferase [Micrococcaceae bacterium]